MANDTKFTKWLQRELISRGAAITANGKNDAGSQSVIREFQRAMGLKVTGTATAETVQAIKNSKVASLKPTAVNQQAPGMSLSGSVAMNPPVIPPMHPRSTVGQMLPPGQGPDFDSEAAPNDASRIDQPATMNMNDPTWQKISPETRQRIMAAEQQRVLDEHNQRVRLQQAMNAKAQGMRDQAIDMTPGGGLLGPAMSAGDFDQRFNGGSSPPTQAGAVPHGILQFLMQAWGSTRWPSSP